MKILLTGSAAFIGSMLWWKYNLYFLCFRGHFKKSLFKVYFNTVDIISKEKSIHSLKDYFVKYLGNN